MCMYVCICVPLRTRYAKQDIEWADAPFLEEYICFEEDYKVICRHWGLRKSRQSTEVSHPPLVHCIEPQTVVEKSE